MKVGLASSSCLLENEVVVFFVCFEPDDFKDLLRSDALESLDLAVLPATDCFIDLPPIFDFFVKAFECLLDFDWPVFLVFASSSGFYPPISSSSSSQPAGSMSIKRSTASNNWSSTSYPLYLFLCIHSEYSMSTSTTSIDSSLRRISIALL